MTQRNAQMPYETARSCSTPPSRCSPTPGPAPRWRRWPSARASGIGTLYRHFPTRDALVEAAYRTEVDHLTEAAEVLLGEHAPDVALEQWMERWIAYTATKRGMADALNNVVAGGSSVREETRTQIVAAIDALHRAGVDAGTLRDDVSADDVMRAVGAVWQVTDVDQARRLLRLLMDGLRSNVR